MINLKHILVFGLLLFTTNFSFSQFFWRDFPENVRIEDIKFENARLYNVKTNCLQKELDVNKLKREYTLINYGVNIGYSSVSIYKELGGKLLITSCKTFSLDYDKIKRDSINSCLIEDFDTRFYNVNEDNYFYDNDGNCVKVITKHWAEDVLYKTLMSYNADNQLVSSFYYSDSIMMSAKFYSYKGQELSEEFVFLRSSVKCDEWHKLLTDTSHIAFPKMDSLCLYSYKKFRIFSKDKYIAELYVCGLQRENEYEQRSYIEGKRDKRRREQLVRKLLRHRDNKNYTVGYYDEGLLVKKVSYHDDSDPIVTKFKYDRFGSLIEKKSRSKDYYSNETYHTDQYGNEIQKTTEGYFSKGYNHVFKTVYKW